jgi:hypothetical protein
MTPVCAIKDWFWIWVLGKQLFYVGKYDTAISWMIIWGFGTPRPLLKVTVVWQS